MNEAYLQTWATGCAGNLPIFLFHVNILTWVRINRMDHRSLWENTERTAHFPTEVPNFSFLGGLNLPWPILAESSFGVM